MRQSCSGAVLALGRLSPPQEKSRTRGGSSSLALQGLVSLMAGARAGAGAAAANCKRLMASRWCCAYAGPGAFRHYAHCTPQPLSQPRRRPLLGALVARRGVLRQLTSLNLARRRCQPPSAGALETLMSCLTGLSSLSPADNKLGDAGLAVVVRALPGMAALTAVDISGACSSAHAVGVCGVLEAAEKLLVGSRGGLRRLALAWTGLGDYVDRAVERLGRLSGLEELVLFETGLRVDGIVVVHHVHGRGFAGAATAAHAVLHT